MIKVTLIILGLVVTSFPSFADETISFLSDMVIRKCEVNSFHEKVCLGDFNHPKKIDIILKEGEYFSSGSWEREYKIGNETFVGTIAVLKNPENSIYLIQMQIKGPNFNPRALMQTKNPDEYLTLDVKDDSVMIKDENGQEWSPSLYIYHP